MYKKPEDITPLPNGYMDAFTKTVNTQLGNYDTAQEASAPEAPSAEAAIPEQNLEEGKKVDEDNTNDKSDDGEGLDKVQPKAVKKKLLNDVKINGKNYYKIEISFSKENGGIDHEDVFVYWISKTDFKIDYLAYKFEVNGGGVRFREVKKEHVINGVCFFDYNNFKPKNSNISLSSLDKAYENDKLTKVSEIILKKFVSKMPPSTVKMSPNNSR